MQMKVNSLLKHFTTLHVYTLDEYYHQRNKNT